MTSDIHDTTSNRKLSWHPAPPLPSPPGEDGLHLWRIDLDAGSCEQLLGYLSAEEISRTQRYPHERGRHRYCAARAALRRVLAGYLGCDAREVEFRYGEKGKPELAQGVLQLRFNMSHSESLAVIAVSGQEPVGVDIEAIRPRPNQLKIAERILGETAREYLQSQSKERRTEVFLEIWTAFEARVKAAGAGIFDHLLLSQHDIRVCRMDPLAGWVGHLALNSADPQEKTWSTWLLQ